jgi:LPXTG-motif cell wall-anchored protein
MAQPWIDSDVLISAWLGAVFSLLAFAVILSLRRRQKRGITGGIDRKRD